MQMSMKNHVDELLCINSDNPAIDFHKKVNKSFPNIYVLYFFKKFRESSNKEQDIKELYLKNK